MRIIFFGTSEFAIPTLRLLIQNGMQPTMTVTAPDRPKGRGQHLMPPSIKKWVKIEKPDLSIVQPEGLDSEFTSRIVNLKPDVGIVAAYGKILPIELMKCFPRGILNIHPSLLPKYRGPSPIQTTIANGDHEAGVTIIKIDEKMDHGPIVINRRLEVIADRVEYQLLHDLLAQLGAELLIEVLPSWIHGNIATISQDDSQATYTKLLKKSDGAMDWSKSAEEIERLVRAYNPWPGTRMKAKYDLKIKKAEVISSPPDTVIGEIFRTEDGFPAVVCAQKALKLIVVQPESKQEMSGKEFLNGYPLFYFQ